MSLRIPTLPTNLTRHSISHLSLHGDVPARLEDQVGRHPAPEELRGCGRELDATRKGGGLHASGGVHLKRVCTQRLGN